MSTLDGADVEAIERATFAAVPPQTIQEEGGWLLGLDGGTVGRAHSAVPLRHERPAPDTVARIERRYRAAGWTPWLRLPRVECYGELGRALVHAGWSSSKPTLTQVGSVQDLARPGPAGPAGAMALRSWPDDAWAAVFLGAGFDPVDGASRLAILRRSQRTVFASVCIGAEVVAVGAACCAHGWIGIHGMRTAMAWRGRGLAGQVLAALGQEGQRRGIGRAFLQVEETNTGAQRLYARAGFKTAWAYAYWRPA